jgi:hypothetical protein
MTRILLVAFTLLLSLGGRAQVDTLPPPPERDFMEELFAPDPVSRGRVHVEGDACVDRTLRAMITANKHGYAFSGYRVQILSAAASRHHIDSLQRYVSRFEEQFPGTRAYLRYFDPDFKIRVGNFRSRIEAMPLLKKIRRKYPASYIVRETIRLKDLLPPPPPPPESPEAEGEEGFTPIELF